MKIYTDDVFVQIKEKSRQAYIKSWQDFKSFCPDHEFENGYPPEEIFIKYFNQLKLDKKMATSSLWTHYSYLNSVMKRKYGFKMQDNPRITMLIKGFKAETTKPPILAFMVLSVLHSSPFSIALKKIRHNLFIFVHE